MHSLKWKADTLFATSNFLVATDVSYNSVAKDTAPHLHVRHTTPPNSSHLLSGVCCPVQLEWCFLLLLFLFMITIYFDVQNLKAIPILRGKYQRRTLSKLLIQTSNNAFFRKTTVQPLCYLSRPFYVYA